MDFLKKYKVEEIGVAVLLLLCYVYFAYFSGSSSSPTLSSSDSSVTLSQNLLVTLQNLHTIKLDDSIFTEPVFQSLNDFGVSIPPESVGRADPFLPLTSSGLTPPSNSSITLPAGTH